MVMGSTAPIGRGRIIEESDVDSIATRPKHSDTTSLLSATPEVLPSDATGVEYPTDSTSD